MKKHTDSELLRLAFKAWAPSENYTRMVNDAGYDYWNPLKDDGQALRLAVRLNLLVQIRNRMVVVTDENGKQLDFRQHKDDPYAATRFAIVRAAAEIGAKL